MRIHVTYTGGTIGMIKSADGLIPGADLRGWLYHLLESTQLRAQDVTLTEFDPLVDSANVCPEDWQLIIDDLWAHHEQADAFVVLHGTDTMSYTSAALSYALTDFGKPVILTGAQHPLGVVETDAVANVTGAFNAALSARTHGVNLFFGHHLFYGNRVTKTSSWAFEGFSAPSTGPVARTGTPWHWYPFQRDRHGWCEPRPYSSHDVLVCDVVPGMNPERLAHIVTPSPEAVILRAYGVGNIPSAHEGIVDVIADLMRRDIPVIVTSQCQQAEVLLGHYETGSALAKVGAVGTADMTLEAIYAKVIFLLSQGLKGAELTSWILKPIDSELTPLHT